MTDQSANPIDAPAPTPGEPIPLEPITLEPVPDSTPPTRDEGAPSADTPGQMPAVAPESATSPPPLPAKSEEPSTAPYPSGPIANPKLVAVRGQRMDVQYPIYPGKNYIGRTDDKPVDIDLEDQEAQDRIWASRQHAVITFEDGKLTIEDLNSLNGTFVNRNRVHPGEQKTITVNDVVQIGTVHLKVIAG
jgi:hypothetical protein